MTNSEEVRRGEDARRIIESPIWLEAWETYRTRLLLQIESADSAEQELVMHCKRLLTAARAARAHLEAVLVDGKVAQKQIEERKWQVNR